MGKGHAPRKGRDDKAFAVGWEATFGKKAKSEQALQELTDLSQELGLYDLPQPKTCQHCKHWHGETKRCDNLDVNGMLDADAWRAFEPPADFGCNRFEGKV
jgi:hypothetical protein